jgi:hypothetical protein
LYNSCSGLVDQDVDASRDALWEAAPSLRLASPSEKGEAAKQVRPFFGFYGGKWRDTPRYYPSPEFSTVVEPFAGSAGYSLRHADRQVILCEIDPVLAGVWQFLLRATPGEIRAIPDVVPGGSVDDLHVCQEARWLVGLWLNRAVTRPRKSPSKWMRDGIRPGSFWGERVRETIASQVDTIRHWRVYNCTYADCPYSGPATWFIDPPYQMAGRHYHYGAEGMDYEILAEWCRSRPGQTIVCENNGANWLPFRPLADVKTTRRGRRSQEVHWLNSWSKPGVGQRSEDGCISEI